MAEKKFVPYVPAETTMPELTVKALLLGVVMAIVLGAITTPRNSALTVNSAVVLSAGSEFLLGHQSLPGSV